MIPARPNTPPAPGAAGSAREWWAYGADAMVIAVVVCLPWSTAATVAMVIVWLLVVLPLNGPAVWRQSVWSGFGGIPVLLWFAAALGMLWGDASWHDRIAGLGGFHKLLCIPILVAQVRRSPYGWRIVIFFLISCTALLLVAWVLFLFPSITWRGNSRMAGLPVPVKDYIAQSELFVMAAFGLLAWAAAVWRSGRRRLAVLLAVAAVPFATHIMFAIAGRSALATIPVLLLALGFRHFGWKGALAGSVAALLLGGAVWMSAPYIRHRVIESIHEVDAFRETEQMSSSGLRLEFWKKSIESFRQAPLLGHGTGEIRRAFEESARGKSGAEAIVTDNPHNQILAVALQLGLLGVGLLLAMWYAHLRLFTNAGLAGTLGLIVVVQHLVGSLFNSHLFDFTQGFIYVFGVGVLGGMALREADLAKSVSAAPGPRTLSKTDPAPTLLAQK